MFLYEALSYRYLIKNFFSYLFWVFFEMGFLFTFLAAPEIILWTRQIHKRFACLCRVLRCAHGHAHMHVYRVNRNAITFF